MSNKNQYDFGREILELKMSYLEANRIISNIIRIFFRRRDTWNIIPKTNSGQRNYRKINSIEDCPLLNFDESDAGKHESEDEAN